DVGLGRGDGPPKGAVPEREPGALDHGLRAPCHHPSSRRSGIDTRWRLRYRPRTSVIDYAARARRGVDPVVSASRRLPHTGRVSARFGRDARMSTVTASRLARGPALRRPDDALPRSSIGTAPMLWGNADGAPRDGSDALAIL